MTNQMKTGIKPTYFHFNDSFDIQTPSIVEWTLLFQYVMLMVWIGIHFSKEVFNIQLTHYQCFLLRFIDKKVHNSA